MALSLPLFVWLLTLPPTAAVRVYAAYGAVYGSIGRCCSRHLNLLSGKTLVREQCNSYSVSSPLLPALHLLLVLPSRCLACQGWSTNSTMVEPQSPHQLDGQTMLAIGVNSVQKERPTTFASMMAWSGTYGRPAHG